MIGLHKLNKLFINYITYGQSVQPDSIANNDGGFWNKNISLSDCSAEIQKSCHVV